MNFHFLTALKNARSLTRESSSAIRDFHAPQSCVNARTQRCKDAEVCSHTEDTAGTENNEKPETRNSILFPQIPRSALRTPHLEKERAGVTGKEALNPPPRKSFSFRYSDIPHSAFRTPRYSERAIALVITLILLSVIT